jgi:3-methyladenine DNA glycosylase AlkD
MEYGQTFKAFEQNADEEKAKSMSAYMRNLFPFLGIPAPKRKELSKALLSAAKKEKHADFAFVRECWERAGREF